MYPYSYHGLEDHEIIHCFDVEVHTVMHCIDWDGYKITNVPGSTFLMNTSASISQADDLISQIYLNPFSCSSCKMFHSEQMAMQ